MTPAASRGRPASTARLTATMAPRPKLPAMYNPVVLSMTMRHHLVLMADLPCAQERSLAMLMPELDRQCLRASSEVARPAFGRTARSGSALDLIAELAECADGAGGYLPAARALAQLHRLRPLESRARLVQEAEEEVVLGAW